MNDHTYNSNKMHAKKSKYRKNVLYYEQMHKSAARPALSPQP